MSGLAPSWQRFPALLKDQSSQNIRRFLQGLFRECKAASQRAQSSSCCRDRLQEAVPLWGRKNRALKSYCAVDSSLSSASCAVLANSPALADLLHLQDSRKEYIRSHRRYLILIRCSLNACSLLHSHFPPFFLLVRRTKRSLNTEKKKVEMFSWCGFTVLFLTGKGSALKGAKGGGKRT